MVQQRIRSSTQTTNAPSWTELVCVVPDRHGVLTQASFRRLHCRSRIALTCVRVVAAARAAESAAPAGAGEATHRPCVIQKSDSPRPSWRQLSCEAAGEDERVRMMERSNAPLQAALDDTCTGT